MSLRATDTASPLQPIRVAPARADLIVEELRRAILRGELPPGSPLVERDLAVAMGVSKTPVREAIKTLVATGLVEVSPYRGATVRRVDPELATNVYAVRMLLEPEAARLATIRGDSDDLDATERALQLAEEAARKRDFSMMAIHNREFHQAWAKASGNPVLADVLAGLQDQTALVATQGWLRHETFSEEAAEHSAIVAAARKGDSTRAGALMLAHIEAAMMRLRAELANGNSVRLGGNADNAR